jgi:hypothetical protein
VNGVAPKLTSERLIFNILPSLFRTGATPVPSCPQLPVRLRCRLPRIDDGQKSLLTSTAGFRNRHFPPRIPIDPQLPRMRTASGINRV